MYEFCSQFGSILHSSVILGQGRKAGFLEEGKEDRAFVYLLELSQGPEQKGTVTNELTPWRGCPLWSGGRIEGMKEVRLRKRWCMEKASCTR